MVFFRGFLLSVEMRSVLMHLGRAVAELVSSVWRSALILVTSGICVHVTFGSLQIFKNMQMILMAYQYSWDITQGLSLT